MFILLGLIIGFLSIMALEALRQRVTTPTSSRHVTISTASELPAVSLIRNYLSTIDPEVRSTALNILHSYINRSYVIVEETAHVDAGGWKLIRFEYRHPFIYELTIRVSGNCVGQCDIRVEICNSKLEIIRYLGRLSYFKENLTILQIFGLLTSRDTYYLKLDNTYSILTSKTVYITIKAYVPADEVINDKAYKIIAIALWVSANIKYVNDPYGFEYIASPRETLQVKAGDCDDFAVLLASMYRSIGLRSAVGLIDSDGDEGIDHVTALVALRTDEKEYFIDSLDKYSIIFGKKYTTHISYFTHEGTLWLIIDPLAGGKDEPWYIDRISFFLKRLIE